ncbi:unnamed protein product [Protopolystoma xenopodis]|uniref:SH3 domain-containing protein n=1 Tax=Protopolystoma xenopodis TaxID=117903 RepID=A0A3S5B8S9_9PLAT|nr:unnamed protein product [Protopolystoma xenopodis]
MAILTDDGNYDAGEKFGNVPRPRFNFENDHANNGPRTSPLDADIIMSTSEGGYTPAGGFLEGLGSPTTGGGMGVAGTAVAGCSGFRVGFSCLGSRQICAVRFAYAASQPDELSIQRGDYIRVLEKSSDGWWRGLLAHEGKPQLSGWFPLNYVTLAEVGKTLGG